MSSVEKQKMLTKVAVPLSQRPQFKPFLCASCCLYFDLYPWMVLLCICWLSFGVNWVYNIPSSMSVELTAWFGGPRKYTESDNAALLYIYSYPNILVAFICGFVLDKITEVRKGTLFFCIVALLGQIMFAYGVMTQGLTMSLIGRLILGIGGESLTIAQFAYVARWFDARFLSFCFGLVVSFAELGSLLNYALTPYFIVLGVPFSVWAGTLACGLSFVACVFLTGLDWYGEQRVLYKQSRVAIKGGSWSNITFATLFKMPVSVWIILFIAMTYYVSLLTLFTDSNFIFQSTGENYLKQEAIFFLTIPYFVSIPLTPLFGLIQDKFGKSLFFIIAACVLQIASLLLFFCLSQNWFQVNPAIIMGCIGLGYSLFSSAIWSTIPILVNGKMLGIAYGALVAVQHAGVAVFSQALTLIMDMPQLANSPYKYYITFSVFIGCAVLALISTIVLLVIDRKQTKSALNKNGERRQVYLEEYAKRLTAKLLK